MKILAKYKSYLNFKTVSQEKYVDGDFNGNHGKGHFNFDEDKCEDGDPNQASASDRGDGRGFQSTQIQTVQFDRMTLPRTITITGLGIVGGTTGLGTSLGLPVTFTFVAVEPGPTTPGSVSFIFSDGYANAGPLTGGSVILHGW